MSNSGICILTDSSAQFPGGALSVANSEDIAIIPHRIHVGGENLADTRDLRPSANWFNHRHGSHPRLEAPSDETYRYEFMRLGQRFSTIIAILTSSHLSLSYANAAQAAYYVRGPAAVQVIDSQTLGAGLGMLVMAAAEAARKGDSPLQINRLVRSLIPRIYTVFCLQSLHTLAHAGHLDPAQAAVGEMLGIIPFYVLDAGKLVPIQKARSSRQVVDLMHEFVTEFEHLQHIALMHGLSPYEQEIRNLRERLNQDFPTTPISEYTLGPTLLSLLGPRSLGVITLETGTLDE